MMQKRIKYIVLVFILSSLTGCYDIYPRARYSLGSVETFSKTKSEMNLCKDLRNLFLKKKLIVEKKPKTKDILCVFSGSNKIGMESYSLLVGAMRDKGQIMVDIQSLNTDIKKIKIAVNKMLLEKYPKFKVVNQ